MPKELPEAIARFIRRYIVSLEQLELLLLLSSAPKHAKTVQALYDEIRSNPESIRRRLDQLVAQGLVQVTSDAVPRYQYNPGTPELHAAVQQLAIAYKEHRVQVIEHIFAEPPSPIQGFADAFRIRKDPSNG